MAAKKKKRSAKKTFRFQLTLQGIAGITAVTFCLFVWMFLLGVWAGQTFLLPAAKPETAQRELPKGDGERVVKTLVSTSKKKPDQAGSR